MQSISKYTLETLQHEYNEAELQPKKTELVTDEEIFLFLDHTRKFWPIVFFALILLSMLYVGWVNSL